MKGVGSRVWGVGETKRMRHKLASPPSTCPLSFDDAGSAVSTPTPYPPHPTPQT